MSGLTRFLPALVGLLLLLSIATPISVAWSHGDPDEIIERRDNPPSIPPILPPPAPPNGGRGLPPEYDLPESPSGIASDPAVFGGTLEMLRLLWTIASQAL